jgi:hypothetical protein
MQQYACREVAQDIEKALLRRAQNRIDAYLNYLQTLRKLTFGSFLWQHCYSLQALSRFAASRTTCITLGTRFY